MNNLLFSKISLPSIPFSTKDLSFKSKLSCNMGFLVPYLIEDIMPSDSIKINSEIGMKSSQLYAPVMQEIKLHKYSFFVPYRILYKHFNDMLTRGIQGNLDVPNQMISIYDFYQMFMPYVFAQCSQTSSLVTAVNKNLFHIDNLLKPVNGGNVTFRPLAVDYRDFYINLKYDGKTPLTLDYNSFMSLCVLLSHVMRNYFDFDRYPNEPRSQVEVAQKLYEFMTSDCGMSSSVATQCFTNWKNTQNSIPFFALAYSTVLLNSIIYRIFGPGSLMDFLGYPSPRNIPVPKVSSRISLNFKLGNFQLSSRKTSVGQMCFAHSFAKQLSKANDNGYILGKDTMCFTLHRLYAYLTIYDEYFRDQNLSNPRIPRDFPYQFSNHQTYDSYQLHYLYSNRLNPML